MYFTQNEIRLKQLQYAKEVVEQEKKKPHPSPRQAQLEEEVQQISGRQLVGIVYYCTAV